MEAAFSTPPTITNGSSCAPGRWATTPRRPAAPLPPARSAGSVTCWAKARYLDAAARAVQGAAGRFQEHPLGFCGLLTALEEQLTPPQTLILRGDAGALAPWLAAARTGYQPLRITLAIPPEAADLPGVLAHCRPQGEAVAYLCQGGQCSAPITTLDGLLGALSGQS